MARIGRNLPQTRKSLKSRLSHSITSAGPTELNVAVGPAWYWNDGAAQRGSQLRFDVLDKDEKIALGAMARVTIIPRSQGVPRDMYAFGLYLRFR